MPWTVRFLTGSRSTAFVQVNRDVELSVGDRDCPLLSPGACPRCAPDGALMTVLAPPVVEGHGRRGRTRYGPCSDGLQLDRRVGPSSVRPASSATLRRRGASSRPARLTNTCSWLYCLQCKGRPGLSSPTGVTSAEVRPTGRASSPCIERRKDNFIAGSGASVPAPEPGLVPADPAPTRGFGRHYLAPELGPTKTRSQGGPGLSRWVAWTCHPRSERRWQGRWTGRRRRSC